MACDQANEIVLRFCEHLSERRLDDMFDMMDDNGTWTTVGDPARFAYGGKKDKAAMRGVLTGFLNPMDSFSFTVNSILSDGNEVAVEAASEGEGPGAKRYENLYIMKFVLGGGKVLSVNEFFDQTAVLDYVDQPA